MPDSTAQYLHQQLTTAQNQYAYFLLAAAASAVALAVDRTAGAALAASQLPLALAVLCWGLSFCFGCRHVSYVAATLRANAELSLVAAGTHPEVPPHPQYIQAAAEGTRAAAHDNAKGAGRNAKRQFGFLITGALWYLAWHVFGMALRTPPLAATVPAWLR